MQLARSTFLGLHPYGAPCLVEEPYQNYEHESQLLALYG